MTYKQRQPKGPKTNYLRRKYRKQIKHIPRTIKPHHMVTLSTTFSNKTGFQWVYDSSRTTEAYAFSAYKPVKVWTDETTPLYATTCQWNDGILTGLPSHYIQPPYESRTGNGNSRPGTSNIMTNGRNLVGGSCIGADWDLDSNRFTWSSDSTTFMPTKKLHNFPCVSICDTTQLHPVSYGYSLKETTYCTPSYMYGGKNDYSAPAYRRALTDFLLHNSDTAQTGTPNAGTGKDDLANTSAWEIRSYLSKVARIKVRNIVIRLPSEFEPMPETTTNRSAHCVLNGVDFSSSTWQEVVWDIIKQDFFLVGDDQYGPPTQRNSDLRARINPKYAVLKDYETTISVDGQPGTKNHESYHRFHHNFESKYPMEHFKTLCPTKFIDDDTANDLATTTFTQTAGKGIEEELPLVTSIEAKADKYRINQQLATVANVNISSSTTVSIGTSKINDMTTTPVQGEAQGNVDTAAINDVVTGPYCLFPSSNRIVTVRIPRFANPDMELYDIAQGNFLYIPGSIATAASIRYNPVIDALAQLYTVFNGESTYKFLRPEAMGGRGQLLDGGDSAAYQELWGNTARAIVEN